MFRTSWFLVLLLCSVLRFFINSGFSKNAEVSFNLNWNITLFWRRGLSSAGSRIVHMLYVTWIANCLKKQTCRQQSDHFIYSTPALSVLLFSIIACSVLMGLAFYYNDMLQKVTMQRTQQFSAFVCYRKNSVKCNACAVARKIETDCFSRNVPFSSDPVIKISRNLAEK